MTNKKITIRPQLIKDAPDFFRIITNPAFKYFPANVKSIAEEKDFLRQSRKSWKEKTGFNFSILMKDKIIGGIGIIPNRTLRHQAEVGYFIDQDYWGKGITVQAVKLIEDYIKRHLPHIIRIEIIMVTENKGSERVAIKSGYLKEGLMKKYLNISGEYYDSYLYAKILSK